MSAVVLDGKVIAAEAEEQIKKRVDALRSNGIQPGLLVILVGDDPASQTYVKNKENACARLGIYSETLRLPTDTRQEELERIILAANQNPRFHGILVQLPLPKGLDENELLSLIVPEKDVDGFHAMNMGKLCRGEKCTVSCTPKGVLYMLDSAKIPIDGKNAVVIGRSNIVGKPMAMLLLSRNATVTVCHSHTENLKQITKQADILVAAIGKPRFVTADMVKHGAVVVDIGINRVDGKLCGDVDFESVSEVAGTITPVPGGVGKMTIAMLMDNTVSAAERKIQ